MRQGSCRRCPSLRSRTRDTRTVGQHQEKRNGGRELTGLPTGWTGRCGWMASKTVVAGADEPDDRRTDCPDRRQLLGLGHNGARIDDRRTPETSPTRQTFAHWPVPVGRVKIDRDLTFIHSPEQDGYSIDEFRALPVDDRAELWDGVVVVRPDLVPECQRVIDDLFEELRERCPKGLIPSNGSLDVRVGEDSIFRPDIQILSREGEDPPRALVVDALPDRDMWYRALERDTKRHGYLDAGVSSYWIVDPSDLSVAVYEMRYHKRGLFRCEEICARGQWNHWGLRGKSG